MIMVFRPVEGLVGLVYLRGFTEQHRTRLAQITAIWCCSGLILPNTIVVVINEHQVKDSIALNFMIEVLNVVKTEKGSASVLNLLKKSGDRFTFFASNRKRLTSSGLGKSWRNCASTFA